MEGLQTEAGRTEQRRYPRQHLPLWVGGVYHPKGNRSRSYTFWSVAEDLGTAGTSFCLDRALPPGQVLELVLYLPSFPLTTALGGSRVPETEEYQPVNVLGRVMWCTHRADGRYQVGVEFQYLFTAERHRFKAFLIAVGLDNLASPLYT